LITQTTISDPSAPAGPGSESNGFHLLVMSPEAFVSRPLPASGVVTLGRSSKCTVRVDDPLASREHARIHIEPAEGGGGPALAIEDAHSANGTRVRDAAIPPGQRIPILPGDAVMIGATVVMALRDRPAIGARRLWPHAYFEDRVEDECARAVATGASFALVRVRFAGNAPWTKVLPALARDLPAPHVFANYGPKDYEILLIDMKEGEAERMVDKLVGACAKAGLEARTATAWFPRHGRSADALLARANAALKAAGPANGAARDGAPKGIAAMQRVRDLAARAASATINLLILGETGVGKDVLANLVHHLSPRSDKPFVPINCASLSQSLAESELFGHEKNAFTDALKAKVGLIESANGGTIFLDEIGDMPLPIQAKLLRVIEAQEVMPVGAVRARPIDVRFIAATNRDLESAALKGDFRRDLMFRLNGITLAVPPLRDRTEEIPTLAETFIAEWCAETGRDAQPRVGAEAMEHLLEYDWPGNIRELRNVIERAMVLCDGTEILPEHLPVEKMKPFPDTFVTPNTVAPLVDPGALPPLDDPRKQAERQRIIDALNACAFNQTRAADLLRMPRRTFVSKLDHFGIPRPQKGAR